MGKADVVMTTAEKGGEERLFVGSMSLLQWLLYVFSGLTVWHLARHLSGRPCGMIWPQTLGCCSGRRRASSTSDLRDGSKFEQSTRCCLTSCDQL